MGRTWDTEREDTERSTKGIMLKSDPEGEEPSTPFNGL